MAEMGLSEFAQSAKSVAAQRLIDQFSEMEDRAPQLRPAIVARSATNAQLLDRQFTILSTLLFQSERQSATPEHPVSSGLAGRPLTGRTGRSVCPRGTR
jgi:hypothetical protein